MAPQVEKPAWPHQDRALREVLGALKDGRRRVLVTSPTGGGKTRMMEDLARVLLGDGKRVTVLTNRRLLVEQTGRMLRDAGLHHGVRAAGYDDEGYFDLQLSSVQTEHRRLGKEGWGEFLPDVVLLDEAHLQTGKMARRLLGRLPPSGAFVGYTATPIGLGSFYDTLITAGTTSELREAGALVVCHHYGPDEPDLCNCGPVKIGEDLSEAQQVKAIMRPGVHGRVIDWLRRINPELRSSILFAPGVAESLGFAQALQKHGITAAHLDGETIWYQGRAYPTSRELRRDVLAASEEGAVKVLCNRFVLREGIDAPWLSHGIFACVFGSLASYLQSGGRLLRAYPGLRGVTLQDHGGNWWRHGSLNIDRAWKLEDTGRRIAQERGDRLRDGGETQPRRCPECGRILMRPHCPCGFAQSFSIVTRPVVQADGAIIQLEGDVYRPRIVCGLPDGPKIWQRVYWRARRSGMTFRQAEALFAKENRWRWPDRSWPLMPKDPQDWHRLVSHVPFNRLNPGAKQWHEEVPPDPPEEGESWQSPSLFST